MLILASASPRRRELLARCGVLFKIHTVPVEERHDGASPEELLAVNAALKAEAAARDFPGDTVIGADTGIVFDGKLIGKPGNMENAAEILRQLSGRTHEVCTAVSLRGDRRTDFISRTRVTFKPLSNEVIAEYLRLVPVLDKAGAYALQDHGDMIIASVEGDPDNVVGLPCRELMDALGRSHVSFFLFWSFARITALVVGGGYVILSGVEAEFVRRRKWISEEEFMDIASLSQTLPGLIACNAAIHLGYLVRGWKGALAAVAGAALPPMVVIMLAASAIAQLPQDAAWVRGIFMGIHGAVAGLIAAMAWKMRRKVLKGVIPVVIAAAAFTGMAIFRWNPGILMLAAIPCALAWSAWEFHRAKRGEKK